MVVPMQRRVPLLVVAHYGRRWTRCDPFLHPLKLHPFHHPQRTHQQALIRVLLVPIHRLHHRPRRLLRLPVSKRGPPSQFAIWSRNLTIHVLRPDPVPLTSTRTSRFCNVTSSNSRG